MSLEPLTSPSFHFYGRAKASYHYLLVLCLQTTSFWNSLSVWDFGCEASFRIIIINTRPINK